MKDFILTYWKQILDILSILFCITFFVIKKRPVKVVNSVQDFLYKIIPCLINECEEPGNGSSKKVKVIDFAVKALEEYFPNLDAKVWIPFIGSLIEEFLSTPQKKGD